MKDIIVIEKQACDLSDDGLKIFCAMTEPELLHFYEPAPGLFIAETPMIISRAFEAGYEPVSMLVEDCSRDEAVTLISKYYRIETDTKGVEPNGNTNKLILYTAREEILARITGYKLTRGMLCAFVRTPGKSCDEVCEGCSRIAILEDVMNPTNVGAIFRSAAALGIEAIILTPGSSDPLYRRAARVAMGTCFAIPWTFFEDKNNYLECLEGLGFKTVAMALRDDSCTIDDPKLRAEEKLAIILGTEGEGLRQSTIDRADYTVKIPMAKGVDSLNVAAASAVTFWELTKK